MSLSSRLSGLFSSPDTAHATPADTNPVSHEDGVYKRSRAFVPTRKVQQGSSTKEEITASHDFEMKRPPYLHAMLAGGLGGTTGDAVMHSLDTVKTRQQGDPHFPPKYTTLGPSYVTILRQEGIRRGLYGGFTAAMLGSFPGTVIFFGTYEYTKRRMLDAGINPSLTFLTGGFLADFAASIIYVPSEVLKTRLQLQGRYNNPFFNSGYNYRSTWDAARTITRVEGFSALFSGYKATIFRDLPFSAFQFAFYEQERRFAQTYVGMGNEIGLGLEILTAASAGGLAGVLTCPLDVVKTRTQTQVDPTVPMPPEEHTRSPQKASQTPSQSPPQKLSAQRPSTPPPSPSSTPNRHKAQQNRPPPSRRTFHASSGNVKPGAPILDTSSVFTGLKIIYQTEGVAGWFRGVGPRFVWTSVQSGTMLVLYQYLVQAMQRLSERRREGDSVL